MFPFRSSSVEVPAAPATVGAAEAGSPLLAAVPLFQLRCARAVLRSHGTTVRALRPQRQPPPFV